MRKTVQAKLYEAHQPWQGTKMSLSLLTSLSKNRHDTGVQIPNTSGSMSLDHRYLCFNEYELVVVWVRLPPRTLWKTQTSGGWRRNWDASCQDGIHKTLSGMLGIRTTIWSGFLIHFCKLYLYIRCTNIANTPTSQPLWIFRSTSTTYSLTMYQTARNIEQTMRVRNISVSQCRYRILFSVFISYNWVVPFLCVAPGSQFRKRTLHAVCCIPLNKPFLIKFIFK